MQAFKTIMISVTDDPVSQAYRKYCEPTWREFNLRHFEAVTAETQSQYDFIQFGQKGNRDLTDTEKACFYSQYFLWKKCLNEKVPILVLEHDAFLERPEWIKFDPRFDVTFYGQHSMEAVMYHPRFAQKLINHVESNIVTGPMSVVDRLVGYLSPRTQSRHARPHARFIGPGAPVKSVLDPKIGTSVIHNKTGSTADRADKDSDIFKIVDLQQMGFYNPT